MKKYLVLALVLILTVALAAGCGSEQTDGSTEASKTETTSVTTVETTTEITTTSEATTTVETTTTVEATTTTTVEATTAETTTETTTVETTTTTTAKVEELVARWDFEEIEGGKIKDLSGKGHDADISGDPEIVEIDGGHAISLDTLGEHLLVNHSTDFDFRASDSFTLTARVKWDGTFPDNWACIFNRGLMLSSGDYSYFGFWISTSGNYVQYGVSNATENGCLNLPALQALDNEWHTLKLIQDAKQGIICGYIDDVLQCTSAAINATSNQPIFIGYNGNSGNQGQFSGLIDYVELYNYAMEIKTPVVPGNKTVDSMERKSYVYTNEKGVDFTLPYRVYYPSDYDENSKIQYPLVLFLHGHGECGTDNNAQLRILGGVNPLLDQLVKRDDCIIIAPQTPCNYKDEWALMYHRWNMGSREELPEETTNAMGAVLDVLDEYSKLGKVDRHRVYVSGLSMGGYGTWEILLRRSDLFAAGVPLCGGGVPSLAEKLKNIPIWAFHGTKDPTVPVKATQDMEAAIIAAGGKIKVTYLEGEGHEIWNSAYGTEGLLDWLFEQYRTFD